MTDRTSGASRFYKSAVATSALPFLALGSTATAAPAVADTPSTDLSPRSATAANVADVKHRLQSTLLTTDQAAIALPARFTMDNFQAARTAPNTYKVKSGDTLGHVALKHKVALSNLLKWNGLKASSTIFPGDVLDLGPSGSSSSSTGSGSTSGQSTSGSYTVKAGDTLSAIAARQNLSLGTLLRANGLSMSSTIYPGQKLKLSGSASSSGSSSNANSSSSSSSSQSSSSTYKVKSGDTLSGIAAQQSVSMSTLLRANGLSMSSVIYPGQTLKLSGSSSSTSSSASSPSSSSSSGSQASSTTHTVKSGDTLSGVAARHGVSLSTLLRANGLSLSSTIFPGQTIKLSGSASSASSSSSGSTNASSSSTSSSYTVKAGDTLSGIAAKSGVSLSTLLNANALSTSSIIYPGQKLKLSGSAASSNSGSQSSSSSSSSSSTTASTYTVKSGDTLSGIAARNGVSLSTLLNANGLKATSIIYAGQTLKLSGSSSSTSTASSGNNEQLIGNTFLHYTYPDHVVANANQNKQALLNAPMPSRSQVREMVRDTAASMGVDPRLAMAHAQIESAFDPAAVSPANAIGTMQVIPSSGEWASQLVGRKLNLLDPQDNITAGVAIIRHLQSRNPGDIGIAGYYQGEAGVRNNGMYADTRDYVTKVNTAMNRF